MVKKYDIYFANLDPVRGAEKRGGRPCLVIQNNLINRSRIQTVVVIPFTSKPKNVPSAIWVIASIENGLKSGSRLEISQIRTIDRGRMGGFLGHLESKYHSEINEKISEFLDLRDEFL